MSRVGYFLRSVSRFGDSAYWSCPNCGSSGGREIDRKYVVTRLLRCDSCRLMFRAPTDSEEFNRRFYNLHYREGATTKCPDDDELADLKATNFEHSEKNFDRYSRLMRVHGIAEGARVFDFGCSWGYGSYQFARAGYDVLSYEIAEDRRKYGVAKLGVRHVDEPFAISPGHPLHNAFDCFFSAHVLEHVPAPSRVIDLAWRCLRPGGVFIAVTPNGMQAYRERFPHSWRTMWGGVHPNLIDNEFYDEQFSKSRRFFQSPNGCGVGEDYELAFIAVKDALNDGF